MVSIACPATDTCYAVGGHFFTGVAIVGTRAPGRTPLGAMTAIVRKRRHGNMASEVASAPRVWRRVDLAALPR